VHCGGRNHWARAWSTVLVGGVPVGVPDFLATVCTVLGIDHTKKNHPPGVDRPIPVVDTSKGVKVIAELL